MPGDEQDKAGVVAPPPLIYLAALVFGLLLNRRRPSAFLPRTIARILGWPLLGGGLLLSGWFEWAMRSTDTPTSILSHSFGPYQSVKAPVSRR
jgi:protein-S-isoprenylcysteine O-methyltransferase Ste14